MKGEGKTEQYFIGDRVKITGNAWAASKGFYPVADFIGQTGVLRFYAETMQEWGCDLDGGGIVLVKEGACEKIYEEGAR